MRRTRTSLTLIVLCGLAMGCAAEDPSRASGFGSSAGGKADDAESDGELGEVQQAHLDAVGACEVRVERDREHNSELRLDKMEQLEQARVDCLREANDSVVDDLESTLSGVGSSLAGETDQALEAYRQASSGLCEVLTDASENGTQKGAAITDVRCTGDAELHLAELIQAFADLGGPRADAPVDREAYASCYEDFDGAAADNANEAATALRDCVRGELLNDSGLEIALRIVDAFPGRDEDMALQIVEDEFAQHQEHAAQVCMVLGAASPAAGSDEAEAEFQRCEVAAAEWMGQLIAAVVPEAAPDAGGTVPPDDAPEEPAPEEPEGETDGDATTGA